VKVCSPDKLVVEVDGVHGNRYNFRKGIADMSSRDAKHLVHEGGFIPSMAGTTRSGIGYRCQSCGFRCWFKTCSRCGSSAERD
jgi:hypothetical protein